MKFRIAFLLLCGSVVFCANGFDLGGETSSQSKTYADFVHDVSRNIKFAQDKEHRKNLKRVNDKLRDLLLPIEIHLSNIRAIENSLETDTHNNSLIDKSDEPHWLYTIIHVLDETIRNRGEFNSTCVYDTWRLTVGLLHGTSWAQQFLDATGKPGPSLTEYHLQFVGNYEQCRAVVVPPDETHTEEGFSGNYCVLGSVAVNPLVSVGSASLGICLPSTCSSVEINLMTRDILKAFNTTFPPQALTAECRTAPTQVTTATIVAILILSIVGIMVIIGTVFDVLFVNKLISKVIETLPVNESSSFGGRNGYKQFGSTDQNGEATATVNSDMSSSSKSPSNESTAISNPQSTGAKLLLAFSLYSNGKKLLNTSQPPGSLGAIHGIRFLSMSWVVLCHTFMSCFSIADNGATWSQGFIKRWTSLPITNGFPSVDTFFTLSGLLTAYLTIREMKKRGTWKINWPLFYFHRFWRLTPPYMFSLVIFLGLTQYVGQGPLWSNQQPADRDMCEKSWWTNLLYINNIVNTKEICFGHSWYLANDMQFFIVSPLMLIPFFFHRLAGLLSCCVFLLSHMITTGVLSSINDWPTDLIAVAGKRTSLDYFDDYYIKPWCRIGPFIIGILAGSILALTKGSPFRMPRWGVVLGWVMSIASGLAVVYGVSGDLTGDAPSSTGVAALYNAVSRSVWGACVSWVIIACSAGYGGPVNALLSWSPFVFLGRLTYMSYLIHLPIIQILFSNAGALFDMNDSIYAILFLGILFLVNMIAVVAVLCLESPMLGLEKTFLHKNRK